MIKRILAFLLCSLMVVTCFVSCGSKINEDNPGAHIAMYLADPVYDFDPANAYKNDSALKIASLLFSPLFRLNEDGKVEKELVKDYTIKEDPNNSEYKMTLKLHDTYWSDGTPVSANDIVFAWKRILEVEALGDAAPLLYQIKNAKEVKAGDVTIDALQIYAINTTTLEIFFEEKLDSKGKPAIDYDGFLRNLTSYALVPLREITVSRTADWAKKPATMVCSGPFMLRRVSNEEDNQYLILERNPYYLRNKEKDSLDKSVTPYRITVDFSKSDEEIMAAYDAGEIFFVGEIPLSYRADYAKKATVTDALSTHTYLLNENAEIKGVKLFSYKEVREALSLAIDREALADAVVFAEAATALVPNGILNNGSAKKDFRKVGGDIIASTADINAAKAKLSACGVTASDFAFSISVAAYDEVHVMIAEKVAEAWNELGFRVTVKKVNVKVNDDLGTTGEVPTDIRDDIFLESLAENDYQVAAIDLVAPSAEPFGILAAFAVGFSGQPMDMGMKDENGQPVYILPPHGTGYNSEAYNELIEKIYATTSTKEQAELLHEAEEALLADMPVIPILFNQNAVLISDKLSKVDFTYYGTGIFNKTKLKNWENYVPEEE